jgi:MFS family permease
LFNTTGVVTIPFVGKLGDWVGRSRIVLLGYASYGAIKIAVGFTADRWSRAVMSAVYGLFYAIDES